MSNIGILLKRHGRFRPDVEAIVFGEDGQRWEMMRVERFLAHPDAVPDLQGLLAPWWEALG